MRSSLLAEEFAVCVGANRLFESLWPPEHHELSMEHEGDFGSPYTLSHSWMDPDGNFHPVDSHLRAINKLYKGPVSPEHQANGTMAKYTAAMAEGWIPYRNMWEVDVHHISHLTAHGHRFVGMALDSMRNNAGILRLVHLRGGPEAQVTIMQTAAKTAAGRNRSVTLDEFVGEHGTPDQKKDFRALMLGGI